MIELIYPSAKVISINYEESLIERVGRVNYQRDPKNPEGFIKNIVNHAHETHLEFNYIIAHIICDRGVSHELVRHRLASFNQESTRYVDYRKLMTFVIPQCVDLQPKEPMALHNARMLASGLEESYERDWLIRRIVNFENYLTDVNVWHKSAQEARGDLPICLKTELFVGANLREWLHIFKLRTNPKAHPEMQRIMIPLRDEIMESFPTVKFALEEKETSK